MSMTRLVAACLACVLLVLSAVPCAADEAEKKTPAELLDQLESALAADEVTDATWKSYAAAHGAVAKLAKARKSKAREEGLDEPLPKDGQELRFEALARQAAPKMEASTAKLIAALEDAVRDPKSSWKSRWDAYRAAQSALGKAQKARPKAADGKGPTSDWYAEIRPLVADAVRREELPVSGWLMAFFGASLMWGGLAFCIGVARKKGNSGGKGAD